PQVADEIAAGEVVERPASVVKELVENALDAGARAIRVEIEDGGKSLIRVSDDGEGMARADAELALSRHATSKIREAADLIGVGTFGFRGEALPAIASVSRFELETSPDGVTGTRLRLVGGKREGVDDAVRQRGTTLTVRALFFNTPARRKFLRAQATETRAVVEAVTLLALTRPETAFTLSSDERTLIDVRPAGSAIERVSALWGGQGRGVGGSWAGPGAELPAGAPQELFGSEPLTPDPRSLAPLLQVFDTYILFQSDSGVAIVDQHSAHERVLYERVMRQLTGDGAPAQRLLLPLTLDFSGAELEAIEAHRELLRRVGFEVEPFSGRSVVVHTAPNPHPRFDAARCLQELVADLAGGRFGGLANRLERFAATFACRAAI